MPPRSLSGRRLPFFTLHKRVLVFLVALTSMLASPLSIGGPPVAAPEYQLKAAFLFNFVQFVEWPEGAFDAGTAPIVIAILGNDPFGEHLDQLVRGEKVRGRAIVVERYASVEDLKPCQLLYIGERDEGKLKAILAKLAAQPILTVGDTPDFSRNGGIISFVTQDNRVRLLINVDAAAAAGLTLSSKLLRPAQIVSAVGN